MASDRQFEQDLHEQSKDSILFIRILTRDRDGKNQTEDTSTGFIISTAGHLVTTAHVMPSQIQDKVISVRAFFAPQDTSAFFELTHIKSDKDLDVALFRLPPTRAWKPLQVVSSRNVPHGESLFVLGYPLGQNLSCATGILSNLLGSGGKFQTTLPLNPGHSGSPVFDSKGLVIGVAAGGFDHAQLVTHVIPSDYLSSLLDIAGVDIRKAHTLRQRDQDGTSKRVFLIVSSSTEEWQIELNRRLLQELRRVNLTCSVLVPLEDHFLGEHQALQNEVLADRDDYSGGIIVISGWPHDRFDELMDFATQLSKPVIFVDQNPTTNADMPDNVSFVSVNDSAGGELAAKAVLQLARRRPVARIFVMAGFAKHARHESFKREILAVHTNCNIAITTDTNFNRWDSQNIAYRHLADAVTSETPFDVVFCTADSITLGCLDAISMVKDWKGHSIPQIVGYDGAETTRHLVKRGGSPLVSIVVQDTREIARASVEQLQFMRTRRSERAKRTVWIKPSLLGIAEGA
jgi:DNA-binding LacI/PurR family transcriptional regulator